MKARTSLLSVLLLVAVVVSGAFPGSAQSEPITIKVQTTYGDCEDEFAGVTDPVEAYGECGVMQAIINKWNAANPSIQIEVIHAGWPGNVDLNAALAAGSPPDLVIINGYLVPNYVSRGLLTQVDERLGALGADVNDFLPEVKEYVTYDGKMFAMPFSLYGEMWHLNLDVWSAAGLVDADGNPMVPKTTEEFLAAAATVKEKTGLAFADMQTNGHNGTVWPFTSFLYQQGGGITDADGNPMINTPEALNAINFMADLQKEGYTTPLLDYGQANEAFINGQSASWITGNWMVGFYDEQVADPEAALKDYRVLIFPEIFGQPGVWSDFNVWIVPHGVNPNVDAARLDAIFNVLKFLNDEEISWARSGNIPVRQSVLDSDEYQAFPHYDAYVAFATRAVAYPTVGWLVAYTDILNEEIQAVYIGDKTAEQALADAQTRLEDFVAFME